MERIWTTAGMMMLMIMRKMSKRERRLLRKRRKRMRRLTRERNTLWRRLIKTMKLMVTSCEKS